MAKARKSPQDIVNKQIARAQQSVQDYIDGVNSVTESPNAKAAQKVNKYQAGVQQAITSGTYVDNNNAVGLAGWKDPTVKKGGARYAQGVSDAQPKLLKFQTAYAPVRRAIADKVNSMPNDTFEQRLQKADANARALHAQPYKRSKA